MKDKLVEVYEALPDWLKGSLTWDQGVEMALHADFTASTDVPVFFCEPHSPWQRATNENTNGLLRQYFPKRTDLSVYSPEVLAAAASELNDRPRKCRGWRTPKEVLATLDPTTKIATTP